MAYKHPDPQVWLDWLHHLSAWPEPLRALGEEYAGVTCYRLKKAHVWIQNYQWGGTGEAPELYCDVLQGSESIFPGMMVTRVDVHELEHCDCGAWLPPTDSQVKIAEQRYRQAVARAKVRLN